MLICSKRQKLQLQNKINSFVGIMSDFYYFDFLSKSQPKCKLRIPDTLIVEANSVSIWLFNSKSNPNDSTVLKKKSDKLKLDIFINQIQSRKANFAEARKTQKDKDKDLRSIRIVAMKPPPNSPTKCLTIEQFQKFFKDGSMSLGDCIIQQYIQRPSSSQQTYSVIFFFEEANHPPQFKFFIETQRSHNHIINSQLKEMTQAFIEFFQTCHNQIQIRYLEVKFITGLYLLPDNKFQRDLYFLGAKNLRVVFRTWVSPNKQLRASYQRSQLQAISQQFQPRMKSAGIRSKYSKVLTNKLIIQKCRGDYCDFQLSELEQVRMTASLGVPMMPMKQSQFPSKKQIKLPHQITKQLLIRTRQNQRQIMSRLKLSICKAYQDKDLKVSSLDELYKTIKICQNCYIIYSLAAKELDLKLKKELSFVKISRQQSSSAVVLSRELSSQRAQRTNYMDLTISKKFKQYKMTKLIEKPILIKRLPSRCTLDQTKSQMNINRLCLGFLNYSNIKLPQPHKVMQPLPSIQLYQIDPPAKPTIEFSRKKVMKEVFMSQINSLLKSQSLNKQQLSKQLNNFYLRNKESTIHIESQLCYHFNNNTSVRALQLYKLSSPIHPLNEYAMIQKLPIIKPKFLQKLRYPPLKVDNIRVFVVDNFTAVTYILLRSQQNQTAQKRTIVFMHDMFDNLIEYIPTFEQQLKQHHNLSVLMINIPGQAYTVFGAKIVYNNLYFTQIIDRLLFELSDQGYLDARQQINFIGIGLGGFILQTFLCYSQNSLPCLGKMMLINSYTKIDSVLLQTIKKSMAIYKNCPIDMDQLPFNFHSVMANQQPLTSQAIKAKKQLNPIHLQGRVKILEGMMNCHEIKDLFQRVNIPLLVLHSLKNCVVNIKEAEELLIRVGENGFNRTALYLQGGHSILQDGIQAFKEALHKFFRKSEV